MRLFFAGIFLFVLTSCTSNEFKFAWLSDTHVIENGESAKILRQVVQDINHMSREIDFVIVTGDITESNTGKNLDLAKQILDELKIPYHIIPGNHDTKWSDSVLEKFKKLWGNDVFQFEHKGFKFIGLHQGPVLRMADGHFSPSHLQWLQKTLHSLRRRNQPVILITHYPLFPPFTIDNYNRLLKIIQSFNMVMFLNGHGHRNKFQKAYGIPQLMGRSTLSRGQVPPGYNIVTYKNGSFRFYERVMEDSSFNLWATVRLQRKIFFKSDTLPVADFSINNQFPQVREAWTFKTSAMITASPSVFDSTVYFGDTSGKIFALNLTNGKQRWQWQAPGGVYAKIALDAKHLVFTCTDSSIYALERQSGKLLWRHKSAAPQFSVPLINGDTVFVGGSQGNFWALDLSSGKVFWTFRNVAGYIESKPVLSKNKIILGAWDQSLYALERKTGHLLWKWADGKANLFFSPAACWPVVSNNRLYVVAPDRFMSAIDVQSGKTIWRSNRFKVRETIGLAEQQPFVLAKCMRDTVFAIDYRYSKQKIVWVQNLSFGYDIANSMIRNAGPLAFFGTKNGLVVAFQTKSGKLVWKHKIGNSFIPTVEPVGTDGLVVSSMDGMVTFLRY